MNLYGQITTKKKLKKKLKALRKDNSQINNASMARKRRGGGCEKFAGSSGINEQSLKFWLKTQITVTTAAPEYSIDSC